MKRLKLKRRLKFLPATAFVLMEIFFQTQVFAQTITITSAPYNASTASADNAAAIQAAINALGNGGTVIIPAGNFLSGPITLQSNMTFQLSAGATLQMTAMGTFPTNNDFLYASKSVSYTHLRAHETGRNL